MTARTYRYQLPKKAVKSDCPDCSPKHRKTLSCYVDTQTGEPLPELYGRCDRESNCGYHLSPYHKTASGLSYADEVYQAWKENNPLPPRATSRQHGYRKPDNHNSLETAFLVRTDQPQRVSSPSSAIDPVYSIPDDVFNQTLGHYDKNQFARLLLQQFGHRKAVELLQRFHVGTSARWPGASVFWYIDEHNRKRGGQIKLFGDDWHTVKYVDQQGRTCSKTSWVHSAMTYRHRKAGTPLPVWLEAYNEHGECSPCLFGLSQLATAPADQAVAVVESPKTAILCTIYFPEFIWLAVGALSYLNVQETGLQRMRPLKGHKVILFPDLSTDGSSFDRWSQVANDLRSFGFRITVSDYLERLATDEERIKGLDLADYLLNTSGTSRPNNTWMVDGRLIYGELLTVDPYDTWPADWDTPAPKLFPPATRATHPRPPLAFDAVRYLRRIVSRCVCSSSK